MKSMSCLDFSELYRIKRFIRIFTCFFFWLELVILYGLFVNLIRKKFNSGKIINISTVLDCSAFAIYCKYCNFNALQCESSGFCFRKEIKFIIIISVYKIAKYDTGYLESERVSEFTLTDKTIRNLTWNILNLNTRPERNDTPEDFRLMLSSCSFFSTLAYNGGLLYWLKWHSAGPGQILIYLGSQNLSSDKDLTQCLQNLNSRKTNSRRNYFICGSCLD